MTKDEIIARLEAERETLKNYPERFKSSCCTPLSVYWHSNSIKLAAARMDSIKSCIGLVKNAGSPKDILYYLARLTENLFGPFSYKYHGVENSGPGLNFMTNLISEDLFNLLKKRAYFLSDHASSYHSGGDYEINHMTSTLEAYIDFIKTDHVYKSALASISVGSEMREEVEVKADEVRHDGIGTSLTVNTGFDGPALGRQDSSAGGRNSLVLGVSDARDIAESFAVPNEMAV
jgi:hypothetical protein